MTRPTLSPPAMRILRMAAVPLFASASLTGCSSAPYFSLLGAFFPAWMFCGLIGIIGAAVARSIFVATNLSNTIPFQLFVCSAIGIIAASVAWLGAFGR